MINLQKNKFLYLFLAMFGFLILFLRNGNPFIFQTLYAEDGTWAAKIISDGWFSAAFSARSEFPVLGLVILNKIALIFSGLCGSVLYLPLFIAMVANFFYVIVAMSVFLISDKLLSSNSKLLIFICILLIPVGGDANEIFGRILNLGFIFPTLQLILTLALFTTCKSKLFRFFYLAIQLIAALTFPVCFVFNIIALVFLIALGKKEQALSSTIKPMCLVNLISLLVLLNAHLFTKGGADLPINYNAFVEFTLARSYLYPFIVNVYKYLNDSLTVLIAIIFTGLITYLVAKRDKSNQYLFFYAIASFAAYFFITIIFRSGLSSFFNNYHSTFPDRYFYGINIIVIIIYLIAVDSIAELKWKHGLKSLIYFFPMVSIILSSQQLFEFNKPKMLFNELGTFRESYCEVYKHEDFFFSQSNHQRIEIPIYPLVDGYLWRISFSRDFFLKNGIDLCNLDVRSKGLLK